MKYEKEIKGMTFYGDKKKNTKNPRISKKDRDGDTSGIFAFTNAQNVNKSWFLQTMMMMMMMMMELV